MLEHGGNLHDVIHRFGRPREVWMDLSTGINPHWYVSAPLAQNCWHRLPEICDTLTQAAQHYYGAARLLPVAGTQAAIQALPRLRAASKVVVAAPSYAEHLHHWRLQGHAVRQVAYEALAAAVDDCDVMVICNPNNPTGEKIAPEELVAWAKNMAARGGWLVVDEAFGDMTPATRVARSGDEPGLIVLHSVGKFFGLAGLRLGFVAAAPELLSRLSDMLGPWTVSMAAQQIGSAALSDTDWQQATRLLLSNSAARMRTMLAHFGITSQGTDLFQWWPEAEPECFWQHMAARGILVRLFKDAARGIRLGLPADEAGWQRLETALAQWNESNRK